MHTHPLPIFLVVFLGGLWRPLLASWNPVPSLPLRRNVWCGGGIGLRDHSIRLFPPQLPAPHRDSLFPWCLQTVVSGPLPGMVVAPVSGNSL